MGADGSKGFAPMFTRKIGKFLRGKATPFQITSATVLGALLATLPGFGQAPLLLLCLFFCMVILNANLFIAGITFLIAKLVYWLALPLYFHLGIWLVEGPLNAPLAALVNAPVLAWFGLEYYAAVPALAIHFIIGLAIGILASRSLMSFRRKMATLESGSEAYKKYTSKKSIRVIAWLFLGGLQGKKSWEELSASKGPGLPVRPAGIVLVVSLAILGYVGFKLLDELIATQYTRDALERVNGATVDLASVSLDPASNRVTLNGLAMADPEDLTVNRFEADQLVAELSGLSLLAKKAVVDSVEITGARSGSARSLTGKLTQPNAEPAKPERDLSDLPLEDYLKNAQKWRDRLSAIKKAYDAVAPHISKEEEPSETDDPTAPGWRERLAQRAAESGYAHVQAESLIRESPRILVRYLTADPIRVSGQEETYSLLATNLSSHPVLVAERGSIRIKRNDGNADIELSLPSAERPSASGIKVSLREIDVDEIAEESGGKLPLSGGTMAFSGEGEIDNGILNLPLQVLVRNTTVSAAGRAIDLAELPLDVRLYGPLEQPSLALPKDALQNVLKEGGKQQLQKIIDEKAGDSLRKFLPFGGGD